jgi:AhpD family alkylhydroperoxidase
MRSQKAVPALLVLGLGITVVLALGVTGSETLAQQAVDTQRSAGGARERAYAEMEAAFGFVPGFIQAMPDASIEHEWHTLRSVQMEPGPIPNKYRELIGLAVAAARGCDYCTYFHSQFARLNGATDAELEDAVHYAKSNVGWSTYLHGIRYDYDQFTKDVDRICEHARAQAAAR